MQWYVAQVQTGKELQARDSLKASGIAARAPQELRPTRQGGVWRDKLHVLIKGYVFLGCDELTDTIYYTGKKTPGFIRYLGTPLPQPIRAVEAEWMGLLAPDDGPLQPSPICVYEDEIQIMGGVLLHFPGKIVKIEPRRRRARVQIPFPGEIKTMELGIRVEKPP